MWFGDRLLPKQIQLPIRLGKYGVADIDDAAFEDACAQSTAAYHLLDEAWAFRHPLQMRAWVGQFSAFAERGSDIETFAHQLIQLDTSSGNVASAFAGRKAYSVSVPQEIDRFSFNQR